MVLRNLWHLRTGGWVPCVAVVGSRHVLLGVSRSPVGRVQGCRDMLPSGHLVRGAVNNM